jgi:hypothetical protein
MVRPPGSTEVKAKRLFTRTGWLDSEDGSTRASIRGSSFNVGIVGNDAGERFMPIVRFEKDFYEDCCGGQTFPNLQEAKDYAWECFRARLLTTAVQDYEAKLKLPLLFDQIEEETRLRYMRKNPGGKEEDWINFRGQLLLYAMQRECGSEGKTDMTS